MTTFHFPPKEFGDRSDVGLSKLRQLENIDVPFLKSNPDGDTVVMKGNGFNTVTKRPPQPSTFGRYLSAGRLAGNASASITVLANGLRAPFKQNALTVITGDSGIRGGISGSLQYGVKRSILATEFAVSGGAAVGKIFRSSNLKTKQLEATYAASLSSTPINGLVYPTYTLTGSAAHTASGLEYETETFSRLDSTLNVLPKVLYSQAGNWLYSAVSGYDTFDHYAYISVQLAPDLHLIGHAVVRREAIFQSSGRAATPVGQVPYPLFQFSSDGGRSYTPLNFDVMFAGSTYQYAFPAVAGTIPPAGLGGMDVIFKFRVLAVPLHYFFSMEVLVDVPSAVSLSINGRNYEERIFRTDGLNLSAFTRVASPPGFGTLWTAALGAVFANSRPGPMYGAIGYFASSLTGELPNMLHVSLDYGNSWEAPRFLPAKSRWCNNCQEISSRELSAVVYEPTQPPQVVRYASTDFGLSWQRRQVIATGVTDITASGSLQDFLDIFVVAPEDGSLPSATPMSGWRFDARIPKLVPKIP